MEYLLVLQWPARSAKDYDLLISLEETLMTGIGDLGTVDSHDFGSGEMNIFVFTEQPQRAFERIKLIPDVADNLDGLRAGYRAVDEDNYKPIFPAGVERFAVK